MKPKIEDYANARWVVIFFEFLIIVYSSLVVLQIEILILVLVWGALGSKIQFCESENPVLCVRKSRMIPENAREISK